MLRSQIAGQRLTSVFGAEAAETLGIDEEVIVDTPGADPVAVETAMTRVLGHAS